MTTSTKAALRYPKGWFALTAAYSFTGLAGLASIVFSLLLFLSIDDNPLMKWLFGGLAIIFELGKFYVRYEYGERKARRDVAAACWSLLFYCVLAAISIGGSIGGINSATNTVLSQQARHDREIARFNEQVASIERQIQLNEEAARKYIELARIATGVPALQQANTKLRLQQDQLRQQRDAQPAHEQSSMVGLMSGLADGAGVSITQVQFMLVCFLSVLLDVFGAFFVSLIGEEHRFRRQWLLRQQQAQSTELVPDGDVAVPVSSKLELEAEPAMLAQVRSVLARGELKCSKRSVAHALALPLEEVDRIFLQLLNEGVLGQGGNRHYYLNTPAAPTSV
jgi:hypothetical protein